PGANGLVGREQLRAPDIVGALAAPLPHHAALPASGVAARRQTWERSFYWDDARVAALAFGEVGTIALHHHDEAACFAQALTAAVFAARVDAARIAALGYVLRDDLWWTRDDIAELGPPSLFMQPKAIVASDGGRAVITYDSYALHPISHIDALGNTT